MAIVFISDLHIKKIDDDAHECLKSFVLSDEVKNANEVYLLGDIFDFLVGDNKLLIDKYEDVFKDIAKLITSNNHLYYIQGNHDFHCEKLFNQFLKEKSKSFTYLKEGITKEFYGKKYYICHGDEVDFYNKAFKRWKRIYSSKGFDTLVNRILPYKFIDALGNWASENSKNRGKKKFDYKKMENKYISGAKALLEQKKVDTIIAGHTHIKAEIIYPDKSQYLNCGYPVKDKKFIKVDSNGPQLISL